MKYQALDIGAARNAIENLLYEYAARANELDAAGIGELLSEATLRSTAGVQVSGGEAIAAHLGGLFETAQKSRHMMSNIQIDLADDGLSASTVCLYNKWVIEDRPRLDAAGRYESSFVVEKGQWRFASHLVDSRWRETPH
jgi:hypothetical protein